MSIPRQTVPVTLRGLDQSAPHRQSVSGSLDSLLNYVAKKGIPGQAYEFMPRPGSAALAKTADAGSISTGHRLATLGDGLVLLTNDSIYRKAVDQWHRVAATAPRISVGTAGIYAGTLYVDSCDTIYVNGYTVSVYLARRGAVRAELRYSVTDSTGTAVIADQLLDSVNLATDTLAQVKARAVGTRAVVTYQRGAIAGSQRSIKAAGFNSASPGTLLSTVNVTTTANNGPYDIQATPAGSVAVLWVDNATTQLSQALVAPSTLVVSGATSYASLTGLTQVGYLTNSFSSAVLYVGHYKSGSGIRQTTFDAVTLVLGATTTFDGAATNVVNVAGYRAGAAVSIYYSVSATHIYDYQIKVTTGGASSVVLRSIHLGSRVLSANGTLYALGYYRGASDGTGSYFLIDLVAGVVVGKALAGLAPMCTTLIETPELMATTDANTWLTSGRKNIAVSVNNGTLTAYVGAASITFSYADADLGRPVELNSGLHIPGSMPYLYDGQSVVEHGFPVFPEPSDTPVPATSAGALTPGSTYSYLWVFEWTDAAGNLHRSAPTIASQEVVLGATDNQIAFSLPTERLTRKTNISIAGYRTLPLNEGNDGSVYYKITSSDAPLLNDPTVDRVAFTDTMSDDDAAAGEPLYINGGVLENIAPPPCRAFSTHKGRLLCAGIDADQAAVWFSKNVSPGFGVAFNDALVSRLSSTAEPVTAIGRLDSYAIACTETTTWVSGDEFPDDTGGGGVIQFQQRSGSIGCTAPALISQSDQGDMIWAGEKGAWRFSGGLEGVYVGNMIQDDAALMSPGAIVMVPGQNQVRIVGSMSGEPATVHVHESIYGTWAKWTYGDPAAAFVDAVVWSGRVAYLASDGTVFLENPATVVDASAVEHALVVSDMSFAGVKAFQRVYIGQVTGKVRGSGTVVVSVTQTVDDIDLTAKALSITNEDGNDVAVEFDPGPYGKCSSMAVRVSDNGSGGATAVSLSGLTMLVGTKSGLAKLPPARRAS